VVTAGGRVLGVTAVGPTLRAALDAAYEATGHITFEGRHFRRDIGRKGLARVSGTRA
jgi:phosphoribosylamine--glycine ligase